MEVTVQCLVPLLLATCESQAKQPSNRLGMTSFMDSMSKMSCCVSPENTILVDSIFVDLDSTFLLLKAHQV